MIKHADLTDCSACSAIIPKGEAKLTVFLDKLNDDPKCDLVEVTEIVLCRGCQDEPDNRLA